MSNQQAFAELQSPLKDFNTKFKCQAVFHFDCMKSVFICILNCFGVTVSSVYMHR